MSIKRKIPDALLHTLLLLGTLSLTACGGGGGGGGGGAPITYDIQVSWDPNPDHAVNMAGGGYNVYYSTNNIPDVPAGVPSVTVPYPGGTSANITDLAADTYYIRVAAYSALAGGSESALSPQIQIVVP